MAKIASALWILREIGNCLFCCSQQSPLSHCQVLGTSYLMLLPSAAALTTPTGPRSPFTVHIRAMQQSCHFQHIETCKESRSRSSWSEKHNHSSSMQLSSSECRALASTHASAHHINHCVQSCIHCRSRSASSRGRCAMSCSTK